MNEIAAHHPVHRQLCHTTNCQRISTGLYDEVGFALPTRYRSEWSEESLILLASPMRAPAAWPASEKKGEAAGRPLPL